MHEVEDGVGNVSRVRAEGVGGAVAEEDGGDAAGGFLVGAAEDIGHGGWAYVGEVDEHSDSWTGRLVMSV